MDNKNISVSKFQEIVDFIKRSISNNIYQKGSILPSEQELCQRFSISRMTVRRAIDDLVKSGWLYRVQGRGTFVSHFELLKSYTLHGFTENMIQLGCKPCSEVLSFEIIKPQPYIAKKLKVFTDENVYYLYRLRMADHEPIALEKAFLSERRFPNLLNYSFDNRSLYEVLKNDYDSQVKYAQQKLNAEMIEGEEAKMLFQKSKGIGLLMKNTDFDKNMNPVLYAESIYHGQKYTFNVILKE
jgi:GntR family transcriptional regulator